MVLAALSASKGPFKGFCCAKGSKKTVKKSVDEPENGGFQVNTISANLI
jgi:hypothetical protein